MTFEKKTAAVGTTKPTGRGRPAGSFASSGNADGFIPPHGGYQKLISYQKKQNIVEGSRASGTSKEMEIKLTNVARASLEELLTDYRDFLAHAIHKNGRQSIPTPCVCVNST